MSASFKRGKLRLAGALTRARSKNHPADDQSACRIGGEDKSGVPAHAVLTARR